MNMGGECLWKMTLLYGNVTDTCLMCHSSNGAFDYGEGYGPGGDFYWVTKTFSWTTSWGETQTSQGDSHGHNVISGFFHINEDAVLAQAPGGNFLSSELVCTSCHDPHGNTNFRMLYDSTLGPRYQDGRFEFTADAPLARGNSFMSSAGSSGAESSSNHTVYKSGMSEWCANCHGEMHSGHNSALLHTVDEPLGAQISAIYNAYVSTEDPSSGSQVSSYLGLVPFEAINVDLAAADPSNYTLGPEGADNVMCLSCHRSHASPFRDAGRWDFSATNINLDSHPQITDTGASASDVANRYYDYTFAENQKSLCNKCHVKDYGDLAVAP